MHPAQFWVPSPNPMPNPVEDTEYNDRPSTRGSGDPPEQPVHVRSRSTAQAATPRRLSVFSGRSRSNTTNSTSSSRRPPSSMISADGSAPHPPQDDRATTRPERSESVTKSFFARGSRILRRQGSKFNISATLDEEDEGERDTSAPEFFGRHHKGRQSTRCK